MNWGMRVLQTLALPLGYVTMWKKECHPLKKLVFSMLFGFFSCPDYIIDECFFKAFLFTDPCSNFSKFLIF